MKKHREGWGCVYMMRNLINGKRNVGYDSTGDPENHRQLSVQSKKAWLNPEMRAKQAEINGHLLVTSKDRARHGQRIKRGMKKSGASEKVSIAQTLLWADEDYRKHQIKRIRKGSLKPEVRARRSAIATRLSNDPIWQAKRVATMKLTLAKPGAKERASKAAKESLARPDVKKKMSRASKRRMAVPGAKKHISDVVKAWWTPERRAAQAERARVNGLKRGGLNARRNH